MNHLEIREILQFAINAIDNETLWEKHYENLRGIEKDLPELVKKDKANENAEMPDSLDKLKISDFLRLELKVYGIVDDDKDDINILIDKIEEIFIPGVFNFKERLKLTLCAVCHIYVGVKLGKEINYNDITKKFKELKDINFESNVNDRIPINAELSKQINILTDKKKEIERDHCKYIDVKLEHDNCYKRKANPENQNVRSRRNKKTQNGGSNDDDHTIEIRLNDIFFDKKSDGSQVYESMERSKVLPDPITVFRKKYATFIESPSEEKVKNEMFECLKWISFEAFGQGFRDPKRIILFKLIEEFKKYVTHKLSHFNFIHNTKLELENKLFEKIDDWSLKNFSRYLKGFYLFGQSGFIVDGKLGKFTYVKTKEDFKGLFKNTPIELFTKDIENPKVSHEIFDDYIRQLFKKLYIDLIVDNNIEDTIDKEIQELNNNASHKSRIQNISYRNLKKADGSLLRTFLLFVRDCVHTISMKITDEILKASEYDFWDRLEDSLGNHISLEDETIKCDGSRSDTSLFEYIKKQLEEKRIVAKNINLLVNKAKLIYLLQNYKCF